MVIHRDAIDVFDAWLVADAGDRLGYKVAAVTHDGRLYHVFLQGSVSTGIDRPGKVPIVDIDEAIEWVRQQPSE